MPIFKWVLGLVGNRCRVSRDTLHAAVFFHLLFELLGHLLLSRAAIHPLRLVSTKEAGNVERRTRITTGLIFIAFFAYESARPATI
jgi:hypothetical protein